MDIGLGWLGVAIGLVGAIVTYRMASGVSAGETGGGADIRRRSRWAAGFTLALTLIFWAITMQNRAPFSPGQRLGLGFLIGGVSGTLAQLLSCRLALASADSSDRQARLALHSVTFLALFGASLTYSLFHGDPQTAMIGFAVGAVMAGILQYYSQDRESSVVGYAEVWTVFAVTIAVAVWLSVAHFSSIDLRNWWPLPILLGSTALVSNFVATELRSIGKGRTVLPGLALVIMVLGLSAIYASRIVHEWSLLWVAAVGLALAGITAWLASRLDVAEEASAGMDTASAVVLLTVAFTVAAFKLWSGLGIALGLLAAWPVAIFASESEKGKSKALLGFLGLGLVILLSRLFVVAYRVEVGTADLRIHYTFIGALLGAIIPFTFVSVLARMKASAKTDAKLIMQVAFIGLVAALAPVLLYLMWDIKVVLGLVFGLTAAIAFMMMVGLSREESLLKELSVVPLVIGSQLAAVLFTGPLVRFELTRMVRISMVGGVALVAVVWLVTSGIWSARRSR